MFVLAVLLAALGCGGSGGTGGSGGGGGDARRQDRAAIAKVAAALAAYADVDGPAWATKAAEVMRRLPDFSGVEDDGLGTASAKLKSGATYLVVDNRPRSAGGATRPLPRGPGGGQVPGSGLAAVFDTFIGDYGHTTRAADVAAALTRSGFRLVGGGIQKGTLPELMALRSAGRLGFFYLDGHGSNSRIVGTNDFEYHMATATEVPDLGEYDPDPYENLIEQGLVTYMSINVVDTPGGEERVSHRYAVTSKFFGEYMRFAPRSVAWPNTCHSQAGLVGFQPLGVGLYLGWTKPVGDAVANGAAALFTTLAVDATGTVLDWSEARTRMTEANVTVEPATGARLVFTEGTSGADHVVPKIEGVTTLGPPESFTLTGAFGPIKGRVLGLKDEAQVEMVVLSWKATEIVVRRQSGVTGLQVFADGVKGNQYRLFRWSIEGRNGGPFTANLPIRVYIAALYSRQQRLVHEDDANAGLGGRGPIVFYSDVLKNPAERVIGFECDTGGQRIVTGEVWVQSPTGKRTKILDGTEVWAGEPGGPTRLGFDTWKLYR